MSSGSSPAPAPARRSAPSVAVVLKGLPGPVNAHEVVWDDGDDEPRSGLSPIAIARADRFSLVGRTAEMRRLRDAWDLRPIGRENWSSPSSAV